MYYLFRTIGTVTHPPTSALSATSGTFSTTLDVTGVTTLSGNVGVGASPNNHGGMTRVLEISGSADVQLALHATSDSLADNARIGEIAFMGGSDSTTPILSAIVGRTSGTSEASGQLSFHTRGSDSGGLPTEQMRIDQNGIVTKPNQPAFLANPSANLENFAINQYNNVNFASERFDRNADYNAGGSPSLFTAPVTGVYQLNFHLYILSVDTAATYFQFSILTSNREYTSIADPNFSSDLGYYHMSLAVLADMDASDTAYVRVYQQGGTAQMDVAGNSSFSGYLVA